MNFEQFFENKKQHGNHQDNYRVDDTRYSSHSNRGFDKHYKQKAFLKNILSNRKLRAAIIVGFVAVIIMLIALVALLFPFLKDLINFILENGISGLADEASKLLGKIWNGSK